MGPWLNILDETFHMHLRLDHITEVWAVRKPTSDGHVTSLECFGADNKLIIQFFGQRQEGTDERAGWRSLVEALPRRNRSNAA
jgi:putative hemin transport protein